VGASLISSDPIFQRQKPYLFPPVIKYWGSLLTKARKGRLSGDGWRLLSIAIGELPTTVIRRHIWKIDETLWWSSEKSTCSGCAEPAEVKDEKYEKHPSEVIRFRWDWNKRRPTYDEQSLEQPSWLGCRSQNLVIGTRYGGLLARPHHVNGIESTFDHGRLLEVYRYSWQLRTWEPQKLCILHLHASLASLTMCSPLGNTVAWPSSTKTTPKRPMPHCTYS
jgi:hypothetical protein